MAYTGKMSSSNYQNKTKVKAMCPILLTYGLIEGRWKTHVMWAIRNHPLRFGEIRKAIPLATERMIARRVSELLEHNLIETIKTDRIKTYRLSKRGRLIIPVLTMMLKSGEIFQRAMK